MSSGVETGWRPRRRSKGAPVSKTNPLEDAQDVQQMLVGYAKQETLEPLKQLGRYLGLGIAGSVLVFLGVFFAGLGTLRLLQTLDAFAGASWMSTLPYVVAILVLLLALVLIYLSLSRAKKRVLS
jgi:uncharacterized BrkB/YihY/UPF0761 family membrane protein